MGASKRCEVCERPDGRGWVNDPSWGFSCDRYKNIAGQHSVFEDATGGNRVMIATGGDDNGLVLHVMRFSRDTVSGRLVVGRTTRVQKAEAHAGSINGESNNFHATTGFFG